VDTGPEHIPLLVTAQGGAQVRGVWAVPGEFEPGKTPAVILAHGAGSDMDSPFVGFFHEGLAAAGLLAVKFNFPYREARRRLPDPRGVLIQTWRDVLAAVRGHGRLRPGPVFGAGKSMGGRIASELAAQGEDFAGLVYLGYPLHPAGRPERPRSAHLAAVRCPQLFVQGTRDPMCSEGELAVLLSGLPLAEAHRVEGGDHSLVPARRSGRNAQQAWAEALAAVTGWIDRAAPGAAAPVSRRRDRARR
jgi:hypothetical protein